MTKVYIQAEYIVSAGLTVDLPGGKSWDDVAEYWVKWGVCHIHFKDETKLELELQDHEPDFKRPMRTYVRNVLEDGEPDWSNDPIAEDY